MLLVTIIVITLAFGAVIGSLAGLRPGAATYGFALWWAVCAAAVWEDQTQPIFAAGVTAVAAVAGLTSLRFLLQQAARHEDRQPEIDQAPEAQIADPRKRTPSRRAFLGFAVTTAAASVAASGVARRLNTYDVDVAAERQSLVLPVASQPLPAVSSNASLDARGISPLVTPNKNFYRIDTALSVPRIDVKKWRLRITGMVEHPQLFTYADLAAMPAQEGRRHPHVRVEQGW